jgi:hypothetical protein
MNCPNCGWDLTGDDDEFVSGGGFAVDHSYDGSEFVTEYRCPQCGELLDSDIEDLRGEVY